MDRTLGPSVEQQARFLQKLQHLLVEGEFVATYKFALLLALVRWALEHPDHDERQPLDVRDLALHVIELYWPHTRPFATLAGVAGEASPPFAPKFDSPGSGVLVQERGGQSLKILKEIEELQRRTRGAFRDAQDTERGALINAVRQSISDMPLWKLQSVRDREEPLHFLYHRGRHKSEIVFEPGTVACLVAFADLIEALVRAAWLRFVLDCNSELLRASSQVETFLFPGDRASLEIWRRPIEGVQGSRCFYCDETMHGRGEVDHFLPWARYRRDLGHNFVLAHKQCNQAKLDHLAAFAHLRRWCERNADPGGRLERSFTDAGLPHDWTTLRRVASSLYRVVEARDAGVWDRGRAFVRLDPAWRQLLGVG